MKKDINEISDKEKEILDSYEMVEYEFTDEDNQEELNNESEIIEEFNEDEISNDEIEEIYEDHYKEKRNFGKIAIIIGVILLILLIPTAMIMIDINRVSKHNKTPIFAINTKTYKDGGTKEYLGLGYKVIKYHQKQGRRDMELGSWSLKYNSDILETEAIDLAIKYNDNPKSAIKKYNGKFMRITGVLTNVSKNDNSITISYIDEDGKYNLDIICDMATKKEKLDEFETNIRITAIGTVKSFDYPSPDNNSILHLSDCFAEQDL